MCKRRTPGLSFKCRAGCWQRQGLTLSIKLAPRGRRYFSPSQRKPGECGIIKTKRSKWVKKGRVIKLYNNVKRPAWMELRSSYWTCQYCVIWRLGQDYGKLTGWRLFKNLSSSYSFLKKKNKKLAIELWKSHFTFLNLSFLFVRWRSWTWWFLNPWGRQDGIESILENSGSPIWVWIRISWRAC